MIISNRHPADELADTRAQLRGLKEREAALRAELLERRGEDLLGEMFAALARRASNLARSASTAFRRFG
jgi:N-methylhydantoinase B/oxoprolinase/acetone carboxylase alpha subunit